MKKKAVCHTCLSKYIKSKPDEVTKLVAGDVICIELGSHNTFTTPNKAKKGKNKNYLFDRYWFDTVATVFGVSYASSHLHPEDFVVKK
jgi:hypothetical protein